MQVTGYALAAALVSALVSLLTLGRWPRFTAVTALAWGLIVAAVTFLALLFGVPLVDLNRFGMVNVILRQVVVGVPLAGLGLAVLVARRGARQASSLLGRLILAGALALLPVGLYMTWVEPNRLVVREVGVAAPGIPAGESVRIGVLADLQTSGPGPHEARAVAAVMAARPEVILLPGDMFQGSSARFAEQLPALRALLGRLHAPGGVFLVAGNVDTRARLAAMVVGTDVEILDDEVRVARVRDLRLAIAGVPYDLDNPAAHGTVSRLEGTPAQARILLAHTPGAIALLRPGHPQADLQVSGHTHGGQVRLPLLGPLVLNGGVPREIAAGGLGVMAGRQIYVSTGVGVERGQAPRMRLGVPPSVAVLTLARSR